MVYTPAEHPDTAQRLSSPPPASPSSLSMFDSDPPRQHSSDRTPGRRSDDCMLVVQQIVTHYKSKLFFSFQTNIVLISHLVDGLLYFGFLSFPAGEDEISPEGPDKLQLLSQAVCLCLNRLLKRTEEHHDESFTIKSYTSNRQFLPLSLAEDPPVNHTSAASICCLISEGSTPGSSRSLTISWESRSVLSSAATSAQNFPARSWTSFSFPSLSSARCRISSHRERRRRRRERTAGGEKAEESCFKERSFSHF